MLQGCVSCKTIVCVCGSGINCETEINDCDPDPCLNGGECIDLVVGYRCVCQLPYSGPNCSTRLMPCLRHRCRNGAQCLPDERYTDYTCRCPPGFTGPLLPVYTRFLFCSLYDSTTTINRHAKFRAFHVRLIRIFSQLTHFLPLKYYLTHFIWTKIIKIAVTKCRILTLYLDSKGDYSATSNNMKLVHWPLMGGLLHLVQRGGDWAGPQPAQAPPHCTSVTAHPSTASVPVTVLLHNGPLLCSFNVGTKGLIIMRCFDM